MSDDGEVVETRSTHRYLFYGRVLTGYGPSMDPHSCGDPDEPCWVITEARTVSPWVVVFDSREPGGGA